MTSLLDTLYSRKAKMEAARERAFKTQAYERMDRYLARINELEQVIERVEGIVKAINKDMKNQEKMFGKTEDALFNYGYNVRKAACEGFLDLLGKVGEQKA